MANIPGDIVTDNLARVPAKSLLRFRCVSKPWCGLIDGPDFIKMHHKRSVETNFGLSLILSNVGKMYNVEINDQLLSCDSVELETPSDNVEIWASCNGLVLLLLQPENKPALFNPATRKCRVLPHTQIEYPDSPGVTVYEDYGFGYDYVNNDYKVLKTFRFEDEDSMWNGREARVYSSKLDSWKRVKKDLPSFPPCRWDMLWQVHLKGALHTLAFDFNKKSSLIVAFNIGTEECYVLPTPNGSGSLNESLESFDECLCEGSLNESLGSFDGCLCITAVYDDGSRMDMWVMKEYGVNDSWVKLLSLMPPVVTPYVTMDPLAYSNRGDKILLNSCGEMLMWYDLKEKTLTKALVHNLPCQFLVHACVGSLVPVDGHGKTDEVKKEVQEEEREKKKKRVI